MRRIVGFFLPGFVLCFLSVGWVYAAEPPIEQKPFATHHIVLQISDASAQKQALVLNVAGNLMKHYGADKLDLEIVAFGPGLRMLLDDNVNKTRIRALAKNYDVKFDACGNTLAKFTQKLGYKPALVPEATVVPAGAARIVQLVTHGYVLLRP
ncbi:DsrE family protein [Acidihalobacter prosperus]